MKMKKRRILSMLLALIMIFNSIPMPHMNVYADTLGGAVCNCGYEEYKQSSVGETSPSDGYMSGHTPDCAIYYVAPTCAECGAEDGTHNTDCSSYEGPKCTCDNEDGTHYATCEFYTCPDCGASGYHETCPEPKPDPEVSGTTPECNCNAAEGTEHATDCPSYICPNCGASEYHETCPESKPDPEVSGTTPECNCDAEDGAPHAATCPKYTCPTCGANVWHETCPTIKDEINGGTTIENPDYSGDIGKHAVFNENIPIEEWFVVLESTPSIPVDYSLAYAVEEFSSDTVFEITDYKVLDDIFDITDEETHEVIGTKIETTLWYQVNVIDGTAPEGFVNGYWILQNYLNEEDAYEYDILTLTVEIEDEGVIVPISTVINGVEIITEGSFPIGTVLSATEYTIEDPSDFGLTDISNVVASYDIKILDAEGNSIQPEDSVFVTMDAAAMGLNDADVVEVIHQHGSEVETTKHVVINGKLIFPVSGFSVFIVNQIPDTTGTEITTTTGGVSAENPYIMTVGESKIFFDSYGGGVTPYTAVEITASGIWNNRQGVTSPSSTPYYYLNDGDYKKVTVSRSGTVGNRRYTIYADGEIIHNGVDASIPGIYVASSGSTAYRGEWQVTDESMAINYEIISVNYQNNQYMAPYISVTAKDAGDVILTYKYVNNGIKEEKFYIRVVAPTGVLYVDDQVAETGCLVPIGLAGTEGVTYTWSRSDGQVIRSEALNADGTINVSLDRGGLTVNRDPITYTVTAVLTDGTTQSASYEILYSNEILNPSFESPDLGMQEGAGGHIYLYNGYPGLYWKTTAPGSSNSQLTQDIEIIQQGSNTANDYGVRNAAHGSQFVELNAENFGALYQDILTTPGATLSWAFSHNGRTTYGSNNTMYVVVAATENASSIISESQIDALLDQVQNVSVPSRGAGYRLTYNGATYYIWKHTADNNANTWEEISGSYQVPEGQYLTRLFFASETNTGGNKTMGNLIDAVTAGETMTYKIEYYVDGTRVDSKTQSGSATVYTTVGVEHLQDYLANDYVLTSAKLHLVTGDVNYPGNVANGLYITSYGNSGDANSAIILKVYFAKHAVTITKNIVIEGWSGLSDQEKANIIGAGLTAEFALTSGSKSYTTSLTIIAASATGELTAMGEFVDSAGAPSNGTYTVTETSAPIIEGYSCSTAFDKTTVSISDSVPTAAIVCTNTYAEGNVTINYVAVGPNGCGTVDPTSETVKIYSGTASGSTATANDGYEFVGWYAEESCTTQLSTDSTYVPSKVNDKNVSATYYAKFVEKDVTINYEVVGPSGCGTVDPASETVKIYSETANGSTATANEGYEFVGWYTDEACTNRVSTGLKYVPEKVDGKNVAATYYAKFVEEDVTINYRVVGPTGCGIVDPTFETVKIYSDNASGSTATASTDYRFVGWYAEESCTTQLSSDSTYVPSKVNGKNVSATYYAKFVEETVTINYVVVGPTGCGSVVPNSEVVKVLSGAAHGSTATANAGYRFLGWYSDASCTILVSSSNEYIPDKVDGKNVAATYYALFEEVDVTINYVVVGPAGCGTVNPATETVKIYSGTASGSTATANTGYEFMGWYSDSSCMNLISTDVHYTPAKVAGANVAATYYAKFRYSYADLTITKSGWNPIDEGQTFIFNVKGTDANTSHIDMMVVIAGNGSITIKDLPIGSYTVVEDTDWSWRYEVSGSTSKSITIAANVANTVEFVNEREEKKWLDINAWCENIFTSSGIVSTNEETVGDS